MFQQMWRSLSNVLKINKNASKSGKFHCKLNGRKRHIICIHQCKLVNPS